jgi:predicted protein tyrosine phosphatase
MKLPNFNIVSKSEAKSIGYSYKNRYNYAVQILGPNDGRFPEVCPNHLRIVFDDIVSIDPKFPNDVLVTEEDIVKIREFSRTIDLNDTLFHCFAGISRSSAAAIIALSVKCEDSCEGVSYFVDKFYSKFPHVRPNHKMLEIASVYDEGIMKFIRK